MWKISNFESQISSDYDSLLVIVVSCFLVSRRSERLKLTVRVFDKQLRTRPHVSPMANYTELQQIMNPIVSDPPEGQEYCTKG